MKRRRGAPALDFGRIARGLARPGMDTRHWLSYATVATVDGEDGTANYTNPAAILVTPAGVEVDVILEPIGYPVTCRFGIAAGSCHINTPIRPGDQVIVGIPDGDASMVPQIFCVINGSSDPMPVGDDGMPIYRNDRVMIHAAAGVPIEIRNADGTMVRVTDGLVELGGAGATEQLELGTTKDDAEKFLNANELVGLIHWFDTLAGVSVGPLAAFQPGFQGIKAALMAFEDKRPGFLSKVVKTK